MKLIIGLMLATVSAIAQPFYLVEGTNVVYGPINRIPRSYDGQLVGVTNAPTPAHDTATHIADGRNMTLDMTNGQPSLVRFTPRIRELTSDEIETRRIAERIALINEAIENIDEHRTNLTNSPPSNAQVIGAVRFMADTMRDILRWIRQQEKQ